MKKSNFKKECEKAEWLQTEAGQKWLSEKNDDNNSFVEVKGNFSKETEKAIAFDLTFELPQSEVVKTQTVWFPKSLTEGHKVVKWFLRKKIQELSEQYHQQILILGV